MKVIEKLYRKNISDILKGIEKGMMDNDTLRVYGVETRCLCEILWSDILDLNPVDFNLKFCKDLYQFEDCKDCCDKCIDKLMSMKI